MRNFILITILFISACSSLTPQYQWSSSIRDNPQNNGSWVIESHENKFDSSFISTAKSIKHSSPNRGFISRIVVIKDNAFIYTDPYICSTKYGNYLRVEFAWGYNNSQDIHFEKESMVRPEFSRHFLFA